MRKKAKKKFTQAVSMSPQTGSAKRSTGKKVSPLHNRGVSRKNAEEPSGDLRPSPYSR